MTRAPAEPHHLVEGTGEPGVPVPDEELHRTALVLQRDRANPEPAPYRAARRTQHLITEVPWPTSELCRLHLVGRTRRPAAPSKVAVLRACPLAITII